MTNFRPPLLIAVLVFSGVTFITSTTCKAEPRPSVERPREPVIGLPCEGCGAVFEGLPDELTWRARIAASAASGEPMRIVGQVRDQAGQPASGVIIYAYHTDAQGIYPTDDQLRGQAAHRHGRLRAWVVTNADGQYQFDTIRPAGYPDTQLPAHVHMHVIEVGRCTYYIDDILFDDDSRLNEARRRRMSVGRGGLGIVVPVRDEAGVWQVRRDIILGEEISGYVASGKSAE